MSRKVSIIIPCRNEENYIGACLDSILQQDYPPELLEVFVCDGKSDDGSEAIISKYSQQHPNIHLLINERQTTPIALNLGIKEATGNYIVILGAHSELQFNYVSECVKILEEKSEVFYTGGVLKNHSEDQLTKAIALAMSSPFGVG